VPNLDPTMSWCGEQTKATSPEADRKRCGGKRPGKVKPTKQNFKKEKTISRDIHDNGSYRLNTELTGGRDARHHGKILFRARSSCNKRAQRETGTEDKRMVEAKAGVRGSKKRERTCHMAANSSRQAMTSRSQGSCDIDPCEKWKNILPFRVHATRSRGRQEKK